MKLKIDVEKAKQVIDEIVDDNFVLNALKENLLLKER